VLQALCSEMELKGGMYENCTSCNELPVHHTPFNFEVIALFPSLFVLVQELSIYIFSHSLFQRKYLRIGHKLAGV
jgi:hypothetical protein